MIQSGYLMLEQTLCVCMYYYRKKMYNYVLFINFIALTLRANITCVRLIPIAIRLDFLTGVDENYAVLRAFENTKHFLFSTFASSFTCSGLSSQHTQPQRLLIYELVLTV